MSTKYLLVIVVPTQIQAREVLQKYILALVCLFNFTMLYIFLLKREKNYGRFHFRLDYENSSTIEKYYTFKVLLLHSSIRNIGDVYKTVISFEN